MSSSFFELGEESIVITPERAYQIVAGQSRDTLRFCGKTWGLFSLGKLNEIETFCHKKDSQEREQLKQEFLQGYLKQQVIEELINKKEETVTASKFVATEVLPRLIDTSYELGRALGIELPVPKSGKEVMDDILAQHKKPVSLEELTSQVEELVRMHTPTRRKTSVFNEPTQAATVLGRLIGTTPVYISRGQVHALQSGNNRTDLLFTINKLTYVLSRKRLALNQFNEQLKQDHLNEQTREAITEQQQQTTWVAEFAQNTANTFFDRKEFTYGNLGFVKEGKSVYIFWEVPKFAMQNPLRPTAYHPFPATKVAVRIDVSNGIHIGSTGCVIAPMRHPFLSSWDDPYQKICILDIQSFKVNAKGVVDALAHAVKGFTYGLTLDSLDRHGQRSEDALYFRRPLKEGLGKEITREEAVKQGYIITNEWTIDQPKEEAAQKKEVKGIERLKEIIGDLF